MNRFVANKVDVLRAELEAINLWDQLYAEDPEPSLIDKLACIARFFRRARIAVKLMHLISKN
jgi:hypothetical protein